MSEISLALNMGIEMRLHLVDGSALNSILDMEWQQLVSGNGIKFTKRPKAKCRWEIGT